ncbi:MAG: alpha/beta hydrolase [Chloroflexia bacterium]|nr:alpha/beta hydrolase [Chloroflexia bacterium]
MMTPFHIQIQQVREGLRPEPDVALAMAAWIPPAPKAIALVCHGHAEHLGRYSHLVTALVARGYAVYGQDHRGHGRSSGTRVLAMRFDDFVDDFYLLLERARHDHPDLPVVLIGHSMGGLIAVRFALKHGGELTALVTSGPALVIDDGVSATAKRIGSILSRIAPAAPLPRDDSGEDKLTNNPEISRQFGLDDRTHHGPTRFRTAHQMLVSGEDALRRVDRIQLPLLAMHGADDTLTYPRGTQLLFERSASTDKMLKFWPGMKHEIFNEAGRGEVFAFMLDWMDARIVT